MVGWRDTDGQLDGPVVAEFQKPFLQYWSKQRGIPRVKKDYYPAITAQGSEIVRAIGGKPDSAFSPIYLTRNAAITNAKQQISVTNAYFVPDPHLPKALPDAA